MCSALTFAHWCGLAPMPSDHHLQVITISMGGINGHTIPIEMVTYQPQHSHFQLPRSLTRVLDVQLEIHLWYPKQRSWVFMIYSWTSVKYPRSWRFPKIEGTPAPVSILDSDSPLQTNHSRYPKSAHTALAVKACLLGCKQPH